MTNDQWIQFLEVEHKIAPEIWKKAGIHFDKDRLYIPYHSPNGEVIFEKTRTPPEVESKDNSQGKSIDKYHYPRGSSITLYLYHLIKNQNQVLLTEGELDTLTATSHGIPSTTSGGVTSFKQEFVEYFKGKKVYVCYDNDERGKNGANKAVKILVDGGVEVYFVNLPEEQGVKDIGDYFKAGHTKDEFIELIKKATRFSSDKNDKTKKQAILIQEPLSYKEVEEKVLLFIPNGAIALRLIVAVAASYSLKLKTLLWLLLVGVPSSGKTDLVRLLKDNPDVVYLDALTQNAFVSGERATKNKVHDLLSELNQKVFVIKDWTTILSLNDEHTRKILGELTNIYDQEFAKFSSQRGNIEYQSSFSHIGAITPATLNKHTNYLNTIGPRFLYYTPAQESDTDYERSFDNILNEEIDGEDSELRRKELEKDARLYVSSYLNQLKNKSLNLKPLDSNAKKYLKKSAELIARCRGIVVIKASSFMDENGKDVKYFETDDTPQIEKPWRAVQQLKGLAKCLAFVTEKEEVGITELEIIKEVVLSSMPADRSQALKAIIANKGSITAKELSSGSNKSWKTSHRLLAELVSLGVVEKIPGSGPLANDYKIHTLFSEFLILSTEDYLEKTNSSGTEIPHISQSTNNKEEYIEETFLKNLFGKELLPGENTNSGAYYED